MVGYVPYQMALYCLSSQPLYMEEKVGDLEFRKEANQIKLQSSNFPDILSSADQSFSLSVSCVLCPGRGLSLPGR